MEKDKIIKEILIISNRVQELYLEVIKHNTNEKQFDYTTSSSLGDSVLLLSNKVDKLSHLVFQD